MDYLIKLASGAQLTQRATDAKKAVGAVRYLDASVKQREAELSALHENLIAEQERLRQSREKDPTEIFQHDLRQLGEVAGSTLLVTQFKTMASGLQRAAKTSQSTHAQSNLGCFYTYSHALIQSILKPGDASDLITATKAFKTFSGTLPGCSSSLIDAICYGALLIGLSSVTLSALIVALPAVAAALPLAPVLAMLLSGSIGAGLSGVALAGKYYNQPNGASALGYAIAKNANSIFVRDRAATVRERCITNRA